MTLIFIVILLLACIGVPLFVIFGGGALALFLALPEGTWASPAIDVFSANFAESPSLMTIPLFTFAGFLLAESQAPRRLIELSRAWLGWMPGGLAIVGLMSSSFFATFTGGSGVTIVAIGGMLYPALIEEKYPEDFSVGLITTAGALGAMFPPSVLLIFYGIIAGLPIEKVLVCGLIPGILSLVALAAYCSYVGAKAKIPRQKFKWSEAGRTTWIAKWEIAIPVVLLGGLLTGLMRFHEASAFAAVYVLFIEVFIYRDLGIRRDLPRVIVESMTLLGAVLAILVTAVGFTGWLMQAEVPMVIFEMMDDHIKTKVGFLLFLNLFLVFVGMFTDGVTAIIVVVPLILPLAKAYHIDPYHLAAIFLLNLETGFLVPPVGMNLFISSIRFGKSVGYVCRSVIPTLSILFVVLGVVTYVPWLSTVLPNMIDTGEGGDEGMGLGALGGGSASDTELKDEDFGMTGEQMAAVNEDDEPVAEDAGTDAGAADADAGTKADGAKPAAEPAEKPAAKAKAKAHAKHK